jgi:hypothetical protein
MKLPDFRTSEFLNALKVQMGVPLDTLGNVARIDITRIPDLDTVLKSAVGLEIDTPGILETLPDGTIAYQGRRVLLYIRDVAVLGDREANPRFHIADCSTLREMKKQQKFEKYVISTRNDGRFTINLIKHGHRSTQIKQLLVCQNCLGKLEYNGFRGDMRKRERFAAVSQFTLREFFEKYPVSLHRYTPTYDSENGPINDYNRTFPELSRRLREMASYRCQEQNCGLDLSATPYRKYLDVHHRNAIKNDDRVENLAILCVRCHAEQSYHAHMKSTPRYHEFQRLFPAR